VAFECQLSETEFTLEVAELLEIGWFTRDQVSELRRHEWIDRVLDDAR
jgi:hypothetical protein